LIRILIQNDQKRLSEELPLLQSLNQQDLKELSSKRQQTSDQISYQKERARVQSKKVIKKKEKTPLEELHSEDEVKSSEEDKTLEEEEVESDQEVETTLTYI